MADDDPQPRVAPTIAPPAVGLNELPFSILLDETVIEKPTWPISPNKRFFRAHETPRWRQPTWERELRTVCGPDGRERKIWRSWESQREHNLLHEEQGSPARVVKKKRMDGNGASALATKWERKGGLFHKEPGIAGMVEEQQAYAAAPFLETIFENINAESEASINFEHEQKDLKLETSSVKDEDNQTEKEIPDEEETVYPDAALFATPIKAPASNKKNSPVTEIANHSRVENTTDEAFASIPSDENVEEPADQSDDESSNTLRILFTESNSRTQHTIGEGVTCTDSGEAIELSIVEGSPHEIIAGKDDVNEHPKASETGVDELPNPEMEGGSYHSVQSLEQAEAVTGGICEGCVPAVKGSEVIEHTIVDTALLSPTGTKIAEVTSPTCMLFQSESREANSPLKGITNINANDLVDSSDDETPSKTQDSVRDTEANNARESEAWMNAAAEFPTDASVDEGEGEVTRLTFNNCEATVAMEDLERVNESAVAAGANKEEVETNTTSEANCEPGAESAKDTNEESLRAEQEATNTTDDPNEFEEEVIEGDETTTLVLPDQENELAEAPVTEQVTTTTIQLNDDTDILRDFLSRSAASKAARIAKRTSLEHRRDSETVKLALASPRKVLEDLDANSPTPHKSIEVMSASLKAAKDNVPSPLKRAREDEDEMSFPEELDEEQPQGKRRSARTKSTPAKDAGDKRNTISVRCQEPVVLKKTEAQELAVLTRTNTRRNKGGAVPAKVMLMKLKLMAPEAEPSKETEESERAVHWNEELVQYMGEKTGGNPNETSTSESSTTGATEEEQPAQSDPQQQGRALRRARALGTMYGTPAKLKGRETNLLANNAPPTPAIAAPELEPKPQKEAEEKETPVVESKKQTRPQRKIPTPARPAKTVQTRTMAAAGKENVVASAATGKDVAGVQEKGNAGAGEVGRRMSMMPRSSRSGLRR